MKEEDTSQETPKKKQSGGRSGRLSSMIESMQDRASPINAHKVATQYFDNFRKERQIPQKKDALSGEGAGSKNLKADSAATTAVPTAVVCAVNNEAEKKRSRGNRASTKAGRIGDHGELENTHNASEWKVYTVMHGECIDKKADGLRFGLKQLKKMTGLSDKTIRVSIHSLEQKMNIKMLKPSLGVYGRKFRIYSPKEVIKRRQKEGMEIDVTTKKVNQAGKQ